MLKEKIDYYSSHRLEKVREKLEDFVVTHEWISEEDKKSYLEKFLEENPMYEVKDNKMYLKTNVPYEDVVEKRYMIEDEVDRNVVSALLKEATSFEALMALGTTSIFDDVMKIIKVEKCVEETFLKPMKEFETIKNIGDYFVRSKFLIIASRTFHWSFCWRVSEYTQTTAVIKSFCLYVSFCHHRYCIQTRHLYCYSVNVCWQCSLVLFFLRFFDLKKGS